jgi:8-oxo-dGTP diphosphatase
MLIHMDIVRPGAYVWIVEAGRVLLVHYEAPDGPWSLVGGGIEAGETAEVAAVREALEETGFHVRLIGVPTVVVEPVPSGHAFTHKHMTIWAGEITGGELTIEAPGQGVDELAWIALNDLRADRYAVTPAVAQLIAN